MEKKQLLRNYCRQFKLAGIYKELDQLLNQAQTDGISYLDYTINLFTSEANQREQNEIQKRLKWARLPLYHDLDNYDYAFENGLSKTKLNQLRELDWLDQIFNIVLMGPSGIGKTLLAAGLCADAVHKGYKAYFRTMEEICTVLKTKDFAPSAMADFKRLNKAKLIVIDDIMLFPMEKQQALSFFNFVNQNFEQTSFIVTTNKSPSEWAQMLNDEVLATALLDRLLYHSEVINLSGQSFRLKNRKTIFKNEN
jgi:DNA replication protein DnaC